MSAAAIVATAATTIATIRIFLILEIHFPFHTDFLLKVRLNYSSQCLPFLQFLIGVAILVSAGKVEKQD